MTIGAVDSTVQNIALKIEANSGVFETVPGVYTILGAETTPKNNKPTGQRQVYDTPDPVMPWRKPETTELSLPLLPLVEDVGLGELLAAHFGADNIGSQYGATGAYKHAFTRASKFKTMTVWSHDGIQPKKIRMMVPSKFSLDITNEDGDVKPVFDMKGANMLNASDWGSASYVDTEAAQSHQLNALQCRLEWGQPGAGIREKWKSIKFASDRNAVFGVNGKDGMHIAGSGSPQIVTTSKTATTVDIEFVDNDDEETARWYEGVNTDPTATQHHDNAGLIDYRFTLISSIIGSMADPWGEADINNAGTTTIVIGGTYSGGATSLTMYEIKLAQGTPDTYSYRSCTGGVWSEWSTPEPILSGSFMLGLDTGTPQKVTFAYSALASGATIAAAIQAAIQALAGDYAAMTCTFADSNYTITHATKQPVVTAATRNDLSAALKLGVANGGTETSQTSVSLGGVTTLVAHPNELADGITVLFSSATLGVALDMFYVYSHRLRMLRVTSLNNMIESVVPGANRDEKTSTVSAYHTSGPGAVKPLVEIVNTRSTAYA